MTPVKTRVRFVLLLLLSALFVVAACQKQDAPPAAKPAEKPAKHGCPDHDGKNEGPPVELGTATAGGFSVKAARDREPLKAGCDAPTDVWITGGTAKVAAVRFWIGTEDAKGSVKAKADIEHPEEPNHWHTHAEIPDPIPAGSKLWVEIEAEGGVKGVCSFDLKV